jgi:hypothetical protein
MEQPLKYKEIRSFFYSKQDMAWIDPKHVLQFIVKPGQLCTDHIEDTSRYGATIIYIRFGAKIVPHYDSSWS